MPAVLEILEKFVWQFFTLFSEMAPFLLLGFLLAGISVCAKDCEAEL